MDQKIVLRDRFQLRFLGLNTVETLFAEKVTKSNNAYELQKSIFEAIETPKKQQDEKLITIVKTLIDFLNKNEFYKEEGIFRVSGSEREIGKL